MFKKLKEKITEEVKSSPQRLQQFTQSVSDKLQQNSVASSDENFFSIGEDDNLEPGFSNVSLMSPMQEPQPRLRRSSNSSIASDVSFLPRYESSNMYHLQSDLDVSASEIEDNVSSSSQLGHLSKEQIYAAFQKSQVRYHKYRGRYTDLARHYKDLERENSKMKSVLVETQDKAIRRVTELKEQCSLEQKAKAHLESALRDDIDERQFKIDTLQTKIELLQNHQQGPATAVNSEENMENLTKYLNDARQEIEQLNSKLQQFKANLIVSQSKEQEYKAKMTGLEKEIERFAERERENNLSLAQSKMELHNEILSKEAELLNFKQDNEVLRQSLEAFETKNASSKVENLQTQNKKLIEKLEALATKCKNQEADLLKLGQLDMMSSENAELRDKLVEAEKQLNTVRDEAKKALVSLETKVRDKLEAEFEEKRKELEKPVQNGGDFEGRMRKLEEERGKLQFEFEGKCEKYEQLEKNHLELIEEGNRLRKQISDLEKGFAKDRSEMEIKLLALNKTVEEQRGTIVELRNVNEQIEVLRDHLKAAENDNNRLDNKLASLQELRDEEVTYSLNLKEELEALTSQNAALKEQNANLLDNSKDSAGFEGEIVRLTRECNELRDKLTEITTSEKLARDEMAAKISEKDSELERLRDIEGTLKAKMAKLEERMLALNEENEKLVEAKTEGLELRNVTDTLKRDLATLEGQRVEQNIKIESLQSEILEAKQVEESCQAKECQLRNEIENVTQVNTKLLQENEALKEDTKRIEVQLRNEIKLLQQDKQNLIDENQASESKNAKLSNEIATRISALENEKKVLIEEYQANKEELKDQLRDGMATLRNQIAVLQQDKAKMIEENEALKTLEGVGDQLRDDIVKLQSQLEASMQEKNKLLSENKAIESGSSKLTSQLKDKITELQNTIEVLQEDKSKLVEGNKALKALESETAELEGQLRDEVSTLRNQIEALQQEKAALLEKNNVETEDFKNRLRDEMEMLRSQLEASDQERKKLEEENCKLVELESQLKGEMSSLQSQFQASTQDQVKLREENSTLKDVECQLRSQIEILLGSNNELEAKIEEERKARKEALELSQSELSTRFDEVQTKLFEVEREKSNLAATSEKFGMENKTLKLEIERLMQDVKNVETLEIAIRESKVQREEELILLEQAQVSLSNLRRENDEAQSSLGRLKSENEDINAKLEESKKLQFEIDGLKESIGLSSKEVETLGAQLRSLKEQNGHIQTTNAYLMDEKQKLLDELKNSRVSSDSSSLQQELKEMERHVTELTNEKQLLQDEIQELKTAPIQKPTENHEKFVKEITGLRDKLTQYKSLDLTNRSSIEFYENELQKLKNQNEKISRKLDETLVTLNHCAELSNSTEIEYLKNVLYNYMLGKESLVMARVIAAVCKFDKEQTDAVLAKEQQKQSLLGQLGIL